MTEEALILVCDEAACKADALFYKTFPMNERWHIIRAILEAAKAATVPSTTSRDHEMIQLCSPDWPVGPQINRARCAEAGLCADHAQGGSIRRDRASERFPGTAAGGLVCKLDRSSPVTFTSCGAESNRHSGAVGAEKRAEQSNPGGCHEVARTDDQKTRKQKPAGMNPRPAGVAVPSQERGTA